MIWNDGSSTVELLRRRQIFVTTLLRWQKSENPLAQFLIAMKARHCDGAFFNASSLQLVN